MVFHFCLNEDDADQKLRQAAQKGKRPDKVHKEDVDSALAA